MGLGGMWAARNGGRSPTGGPFAELGLNADLQLWVEPLPRPRSAAALGWEAWPGDDLGGVWRWSIQRSRLAQGQGAIQAMAARPASAGPGRKNCWGVVTISTQRSPPVDLPAEEWRWALPAPHSDG